RGAAARPARRDRQRRRLGLSARDDQSLDDRSGPRRRRRRAPVSRAPVLVACAFWAALRVGCHSGELRPEPPSLVGTWRLEAADKLLPDGTRAPDYGAHPDGRLMIDGQGRYVLVIFKAERPDFASPDKAHGTDAEFRAAALGVSCHHGT